MAKTESQIITDIHNNGRKLAHFFIAKLDGTDWLREFQVADTKLNCGLWIIAHLAWSQNMLMLKSAGHPGLDIAWLDRFEIGSSSSPQNDWASKDEIFDGFNAVHNEVLQYVPTLTDDDLDSRASFPEGTQATKRGVLYHSIRHESNHVGHLSWLCKLNGIKTI